MHLMFNDNRLSPPLVPNYFRAICGNHISYLSANHRDDFQIKNHFAFLAEKCKYGMRWYYGKCSTKQTASEIFKCRHALIKPREGDISCQR